MKKEETDVERKIDILDDMIGALVDLLEEKKVIVRASSVRNESRTTLM